MSKQDVDSLIANNARISLRQIVQLCSAEAGAADESADSFRERAADAHVAAYLAANGVPEQEPLEAYGLAPSSIADWAGEHKPQPLLPNSTGHGADLPVSKLRRMTIWVPLLLASAAVAIFFTPILFPLPFGTERQTQTSLCAPLGEHRTATLADGSTVIMNSGTCITAKLSMKERALTLESGEAVIQVASKRNRPFMVKVGHIRIRVLGTRFEVYGGLVSPYTSERVTRIVVIDGTVQITPNDRSFQDPIRLTADEQIEIPNGHTSVLVRRHVTDRDIERMTAWEHGDIDFENQPLREILGEFSRYQPVQFDSEDPEILNRRFTGVFHTKDIDSFLKLLSTQCIQSKREDGGWRIVLSRCQRAR